MYDSKSTLNILFAAVVTGCIFSSAFFSLGLNIYAIIEKIRKYKLIIKKKKKQHDEIALLAKTKLDCRSSDYTDVTHILTALA